MKNKIGIIPLLAVLPLGAAFAQDLDPEQEPFSLGSLVLESRLGRDTLLETPIATSVVDGSETELGRQDRLEDAIQSAPNTFFVDQGGPITVRGVTSLGIAGGVDRQSAVGLFVDGVYIPRPFSYREFATDVDRIEIARGSQATLFGKNTIGGAVNILTRDPDGTRSGKVTVGFDDTGLIATELALQIPLSDRFAIRGVLSYRNSDGYITNLFNGEKVGDVDNLFGRIVVTGELASGTMLRFSVDANRDDSDGGLWFTAVDQALALQVNHDFPVEFKSENGGVTFQLDHDFGPVALTSITAYRQHELTAFLDGDFSPFDQVGQGQLEDQQQFSQELRLASTGDRNLDWLVGLYYFWEDFEGSQSFDLTFFPRSQWSGGSFDQINNSLAVYGQLDWEFAPKWELSTGLRYTRDRKETRSAITSASGTFFFGPTGTAAANQTFTAWSPEVSLTYELSAEQRIFARYAEGFKSGGISPFLTLAGGPNIYRPETTKSFELGYRFASDDGRYLFSANAFYTEWEDQQVFISVTPTQRVIQNAGEASAAGIELEGSAQVSDSLWMRASYGYTDAEYDTFNDTVLGANFSGNRLVHTPDHTFSLGLEWNVLSRAGLDLVATLDYQYQSGFFFRPDNAFKQGETHVVDIGVSLIGDAWSTRIYAGNVFDERFLTNYFNFGGTDIGVAAPGRVFGVTFSRSF